MAGSERIRKVEAIVISHTDYGETDRILNLFTREVGKIHAIAKGVRKEHSRKAGHLEPFTCVTLMLARGTSLWIISQAETVADFADIKADLERTALAAYCLELVDRFTTEEENHPQLYRLLRETLTRFSSFDPSYNITRFFEMRFLEMVGFRPELFHCVQCRAEIKPEDQFISIAQGGVLCPKCGTRVDNSLPVQVQTLKYLRHFQRSDYEQVRKLEISSTIQQKMESFMQRYIAYLAEKKLNTPGFYRAIRSTGLNETISDDHNDKMIHEQT
jgi:DNA repair protein RecO (recombination protein O)